ncbi:MAG: FKBP-type peptidyl-prolyl cis-trans isomerase [Lacipirellulaceae bacterium]
MNRSRITVLALALFSLVAFSCWSVAQDEELPARGANGLPPQRQLPKTDARHHSYAIGLNMGASLNDDEIEVDVDSLVAGLKDGLKRAEPRYSQEILGAAMQRLSTEQMEKAKRRMAVLKKQNEAFLAKNAQAKGVQVTKSGLQYQVLASGKGDSPKATDSVRVHYQGSLIDGSVFDGSIGGPPFEFALTPPDGRPGVIAGWIEALQRMKPGDRWRIFIPSELAYGEQGFGEVIPPHSTLVFELELIEVL